MTRLPDRDDEINTSMYRIDGEGDDLAVDDPETLEESAYEELEDDIAQAALSVESIPREALFLAGKAFFDYRRRRGGRDGVLPDFFIGAHAAVAGCALLTRDVARYRTYFPSVRLISPS